MSPTLKTTCPACQRKLMLQKTSGHVRCPRCDHRWIVNGVYPVALPAVPPPVAVDTFGAATEAESTPLQTAVDDAPAVALDDEGYSRGGIAIIAACAGLVMAAGIGLLWLCLRGGTGADDTLDDPFADVSFESTVLPAKSPKQAAAALDASSLLAASAKGYLLPPQAPPGKLAPLAGKVKPIATAVDAQRAKIDQAVERGVAYLDSAARNEGRAGAKALAGLTLLHCGRPATDPVVVHCAQQVRQQAPSMVATYELALCVMFLDRLGDKADVPLIRSIALQLIAGQGVLGGWNYHCQPLNPGQQQQLLALLQSKTVTTAQPASAAQPALAPGSRGFAVPGDLADLPVFQHRPGTKLQYKPHAHEDNSLTQFVILALWSAQRHGVPAERPLAFVEARFRSSQADDGSWEYTWTPAPRRHRVDSMTCAGLLGLAVGRGSERTADLKQGDPAIDRALKFVSQRISALDKAKGQGGNLGASTWGNLYYLWTLERAAVAYDLQTIGGKDWHAWGAPIILNLQNRDGGWQEAHGAVPDTCFALLFLKRANVAQDLTVRLQELAISKAIGERTRPGLESGVRVDPFERRPSLDRTQREAAGYSRGSEDRR